MRIVYKETVLDRIQEALADGAERGKHADRIVVSRVEMKELTAIPCGADGSGPTGSLLLIKDGEIYVDGVQVVLEHAPALAHG